MLQADPKLINCNFNHDNLFHENFRYDAKKLEVV